jgi:hypothetical protein
MFSPSQLKNWTTSHLKACPWYIDCKQGFIPQDEEALFETLNECANAPEFDEFAGLDDNAKSRAIKRREAANKRKVDKLEEARKLSEDSKKRKLEKLAEKDSKKGKKRVSKKKVEKKSVEEDEPTESNVYLKEESSGFSLTEERLLHGPSPTFRNIAPVPALDECILNVSVGDLGGTGDGSNSSAYKDAITFMEMVRLS